MAFQTHLVHVGSPLSPRAASGRRVPALLACGLLLAGCVQEVEDPRPKNVQTSTAAQVTTASREGKIDNFPCSQCHKEIPAEALTAPGRKSKHEMALEHIQVPCLTCHTAADMDHLHDIPGNAVSFDDVHVVCGQCHADKLADWQIGAHGKTVGGWAKARQRYTCTECHNPHAPAIQPVKALPAPPFPKLGIRKHEEGAHE